MNQAVQCIVKCESKADFKQKRLNNHMGNLEYQEVGKVIKIMLKIRNQVKTTETSGIEILTSVLGQSLDGLVKKSLKMRIKVLTGENQYKTKYTATQGAIKQLLELHQQLLELDEKLRDLWNADKRNSTKKVMVVKKTNRLRI